jgi:ABC-type dipeptide/oligopeptide/nickel transport system permease subunit
MATRNERLAFTFKRFRGFLKQFGRSKLGIVGVLIVVFFVGLAFAAPLLTPYDPIRPSEGIDKYPALTEGRSIAERLCVPVWYKFLPWVSKGQFLIEEKFYNVIEVYYGQEWQLFGREGQANATDTSLRLTKRVASIANITATSDSTTRTLDPTEWQQNPNRPEEIMIAQPFPTGTRFTVEYFTGTDITENMKLASDPTFASEAALNVWRNQTNRPDIVTVQYNSEKGYVTTLSKDSGCIEISFDPHGAIIENAEVTLSIPFQYPYYEPPKSFLIHYGALFEAAPSSSVALKLLFTRETQTGQEEYIVARRQLLASTIYRLEPIISSQNDVLDNIGVNPVTNKIFPLPGQYAFSIRITLRNLNQTAKIYLDNVDCVLYGNAFGLLGTDNTNPYPRDLFSSLVYGTRVSLFIGIVSALLSTLIGLFLGLVSGYIGGIVDEGIMRFADLLLVLPTLPLFIVLIMALRQFGAVSMWNIIIIITFFGWMTFARSVRSMVLSLRERAFIEAAKASGAGKLHIISRHILPNVFALVYITLATSVPGAIVLEASLSFLGLGDPRIASWGKILYDFESSGTAVTKGLTEYWFWIFPACICIALLAAAFILIGYALDEILNPKLRERV